MSWARYILLLATVWLAGCKPEPQESLRGSYNATTRLYTHAHFGLALRIPDEWFIPEEQFMQGLLQQGRELVPAHLAPEVTELDSSNPILFSAFRYPFDAAESFNMSLMIMATRLGTETRNAAEYLQRSEEVASSSKFRLHFSDLSEVALVNKPFQRKTISIPIGPVTLEQEYLLCEHEDHVFGFILTYSEPEEREALYTILRGIEWSDE